jgi:hypothetical protein
MFNINKVESSHKRPWAKEEDILFLQGIERYNSLNIEAPISQDPFYGNCSITYYKRIKNLIPDLDRTPKQMKERYLNHLSPKMKKNILPEHQDLIVAWHEEYGNAWSKIAEMACKYIFNQGMYYNDQMIKRFCTSAKQTTARKDTPAQAGFLEERAINTWSAQEIAYIQEAFAVESNQDQLNQSLIEGSEETSMEWSAEEIDYIQDVFLG